MKLAQRSIGRNNPNTQHHKCSISSTNFSTYTYPVYSRKPAENYKTLHRLVSLEKSLKKAIRRPAKGTISRPLLREVTYRILLFLLIMQGPFRYRKFHGVKPHPICHLFSLWADQFPLALEQMSGSGRTLTLN